jgi:60 kDa SS-A/Ro ribonucleoprotein
MPYDDSFRARAKGGSRTPQAMPLPGREADMATNFAGGAVFTASIWDRLRRFLILGSDQPTFYADGRTMTLGNVGGILDCLEADGLRTVRAITAVSAEGLAPKNDPALYALALAASYGVQPSAACGADAPLASRLTRSADPKAESVRRAAFGALPHVARTGAHLLQFIGFLESLRGWGQGPMKAVRRWLDSFGDEDLALQAVKYRSRGGWKQRDGRKLRDSWTLRDILRLAHPVRPEGEARRALVDWIAHRGLTASEIAAHEDLVAGGESRFRAASGPRATPRRHAVRPGPEVTDVARRHFRVIDGYHLAASAASAAEAARVVRSHSLPFEAVPSEFLNDRAVWDALLADMPLLAMIRNLNKMTAVGLVTQGSEAARHVAGRLANESALAKARVHPFNMLVALKAYAQGRGILGDHVTWTPAQDVLDALDAGFYAAFRAVRPSGKRLMLGIDISGSMDTSFLVGGWRSGEPVPGPVSARVAAAAMAMVTNAAEGSCHAVGFTSGGGGYWTPPRRRAGRSSRHGSGGVTPLALSSRRRLDDVCAEMARLPMGSTDCALPVLYAMEHGIEADAFVIYTDNETWSGDVHVSEALGMYRSRTGIDARLVACALTATSYSVADPADPRQMNVVGFDASAPAIISDFVGG